MGRRASGSAARRIGAGKRPGRHDRLGRAPSTPWATSCCGSTPSRSASRPASRSSTAAMPPICSTWSADEHRPQRARPPLSQEGDLPRDLLLRRQRPGAGWRRCCTKPSPGAQEWQAELKRLFAGYVAAKQRQQVVDYDDLLLYWSRAMAVPAIAEDIGRRFDFVLVDEYQDTNALQAEILLGAQAGRPRPHRGRRRRPVDLWLSRRDRAQHPGLPGAFEPPAAVVKLEQNYRSTQPILDAANAVIGAGAATAIPKSLFSAGVRRSSPGSPWSPTRPARSTTWSSGACQPRGRHRASRAGGPVPHRPPQRRARGRARRRNIPFVKYGGLKFLERPTSRTCWPCCAGPRTRATGSPPSVFCSSCPASVPARRARCWHISRRRHSASRRSRASLRRAPRPVSGPGSRR